MTFFIILFTLIVLLWLVALFCLSGPDLSSFDSTLEDVANNIFDSHQEDSEHNKKILTKLAEVRQQVIASKSLGKGLKIAREFADKLSYDLVTDTKFIPVSANGVSCEWAIASNADPKKRIVFINGGAFLFGSTTGHRKFTDQLSRLANAAVLAVDYRKLPRHSRAASIQDAQQAYLWALENGPDNKEPLDFLMVSGDSAGGNLAHMLASWSEDQSLRKPDCVISFSPSLDKTFSSPTIESNQSSDRILRSLGLLTKLPKPLRLWILLISMRMAPANPLVSPIFSDLSSLPPTLIHASSSEMLLGESIRYTNKARSQGANIRLQVWRDQVHDWHLFNMGFGSANVAWNEIAKFISEQKAALNLLPDSIENEKPSKEQALA